MPLYLMKVAVYDEIALASTDSFIGGIFVIKLLWTITTKESGISPDTSSS